MNGLFSMIQIIHMCYGQVIYMVMSWFNQQDRDV